MAKDCQILITFYCKTMKNINLQNINSDKVIQVVLVILILFLAFGRCQSNSDLKVAENLKKEIETRLNSEIERLKEQNNDLNKVRKISEEQIAELENAVSSKDKTIAVLQKEVVGKTNQVKKFTRSDISDYFIDLYKLPKDVKTTANGTELTDIIARLNITDLIIGQSAKAQNKLYKSVILDKDKIIKESKNIIAVCDSTNINLNSMLNIEQQKTLNEKDYNIVLIKEVKKQSRNKTFWKFTAGILAATTIFFVVK
jgi:cell division septum initiation protein DivIVA